MSTSDKEIPNENIDKDALGAGVEYEDDAYWTDKEAKKTVKSIKEIEELILKAKIVVSKGDKDEGMALFEQAKKTANWIDGYGYRENIFELIAKAQLSSGMSNEAFETTKMIENSSLRASILNEISNAQADSGMTKEASETAKTIENDFYRSSALNYIERSGKRA